MSDMSKRRIIRSALEYTYASCPRAKWWLKDTSLIPLIESVQAAIHSFKESSSVRNFKILKQGERGLIFRIEASPVVEETFIVKVFCISCLRQKLKYHWLKYSQNKFAFGEGTNLIIAAGRGLMVPKVYAYGRMYGACHLIQTDILIIEDLTNTTPIGELLELNKGNEIKCSEILGRSIPLFAHLYQAKCNNIDVNPGSIMLCSENSEQGAFMVDFEYAKFYDKPSLEILMFEAAHFTKHFKSIFPKEIIVDWLAELLATIGIRDHRIEEKLMERFDYYFDTYPSRKERARIR